MISYEEPHRIMKPDADVAAKYWQALFRQSGPQQRLYCFPLEYQWPRTETVATAAEDLFGAVLRFCVRYDVRLNDLLHGIWAIVSARHMPAGHRTNAFTEIGRAHV